MSTGQNGCSSNNGGCSHLCFPGPSMSKRCACPPKPLALQPDGFTCSTGKSSKRFACPPRPLTLQPDGLTCSTGKSIKRCVCSPKPLTLQICTCRPTYSKLHSFGKKINSK